MRIRAPTGVGQPKPRPSAELEPLKSAVLSAKTDNELMAAVGLVGGEDQWEEQPDLYDWCDVLDRLDEALETAILRCPTLLLIQANQQQSSTAAATTKSPVPEAERLSATAGVERSDGGLGAAFEEEGAASLVLPCLRFLAVVLRTCVNKHVFCSTEHLRALLAARDDDVADAALRCLTLLTMPPLLHRHQQPELHSMCSVHNDKAVATELTAMSGGWGGRGQGLGLLACVTGAVEGEETETMQDDPIPEQPSSSSSTTAPRPILPAHAGDLSFEYTPVPTTTSTADGAFGAEAGGGDGGSAPGGYAVSRTIYVPTAPASTSAPTAETAADMFERLTKEHAVPKRRLFSLLARVRTAVAWGGGLEARRGAVRRRIMALTALVYCHPSQEVLMAYITLQPELIQELVDLVRVRTEPAPARDTVPLDISVLAVHCLAALVHTRSGGTSLGLVARHTHVFQELGITRGQYTGLLPLLVRHGVANLFTMPDRHNAVATAAAARHSGAGEAKGVGGGRVRRQRVAGPAADGGWAESKDSDPPSSPPPDAALSLGMAFVEAAGASPKTEPVPAASASAEISASSTTGLSELDQLRWVEAVFSLVWAVVSVQLGAAAMTECGLIPALLNVVQLNMDGQGFGGMGQPFHRRYVVSQAIQIMETAVVNNNTALATFREMDAAEVLAAAFSTELKRLRDAGSPTDATDPDGAGMLVDGGVSGAATPAGKGKAGKPKAKGKGKGPGKKGGGASLSVAEDEEAGARLPLCPPSPSQKALLFSLLNALSISAQHQAPSHLQAGSDPLLEAFLTAAVLDVFRNSEMFGGVLVALTATLISDVANQDPSATVAYLLSSGIVDAYLTVLMTSPPHPSSEFLVTVPQVLHAMCLTHDGAAAVQKRNVFPALFRMLHSPDYIQPQARSSEGNMTSVVGAGLDELMRHVPSLRPQCIQALVGAMKEMVAMGDTLLIKEMSGDCSHETMNERSLLQQYAAHFGQLLESVLARPEQAKPFADAGGDDVLLSMFSLAVPGPRPLLARASCAWGHTSQGLANHPAAHSLTAAVKALGTHDTGRLLKRVLAQLDKELDKLDAARVAVTSAGGVAAVSKASAAADVMEIEDQAPPAAAVPPVSKKGKGKGKDKASSAGAEDSDVDMRDVVDWPGEASVAAMVVDAGGGGGDEDQVAGGGAVKGDDKQSQELDMVGLLDCIPREPVYVVWPLDASAAVAAKDGEFDVLTTAAVAGVARSGESSTLAAGSSSAEVFPLITAYTSLLRCLAVTEWLAGALALLTRWVHSRSAQTGAGQQAVSRWGPILVSGSGRAVLERLMTLHRYILMEVSRARADHQSWLRELEVADTAAREKQVLNAKSSSSNLEDPEKNDWRSMPSSLRPNAPQSPWPEPDFYRIHIVAQEGAAVGSNVDSDGAAPVHTLEHGTMAVAYERAANSAGVMRYRTRHGWISENMRGNGRTPVAEVVAVGLVGQGDPSENDIAAEVEKRRLQQQQHLLQAQSQPQPRRRPVNGLRAAGSNSLARLHMVIKQLITAFSRVLAGSMPRPHHREDLSLAMNPVAPAVCEFLSESLRAGLALGLGKTGVSYVGELSAEARCTHLAGVLETVSSALFDERRQVVNTLLLVRMERRGAPFRLLLEACSFIFDSAIEMAGGPKPPESPTLPFQGGGATGGVEESKGGESKPGTQEGWEAFNRRMDAQDRAVAEAATAAAAAAASGKTKGTGITGDVSGGGATRGNLPPAMVEVLKVSLSLLRRLCIKNLANVGGPFSSSMSMWYSAHPQQRREWENALALAGEPVPPVEEQLPSTPAEAREARRASETRRAAAAAVAAAVREGGGAEEEKAEGAEDDEDGDGDDDEDGEETDDDPSPPPPPAAGGTVPMTAEATVGVAGAAGVAGDAPAPVPAVAAAGTGTGTTRTPPEPMSVSTPVVTAGPPPTPGGPARGGAGGGGTGSSGSSSSIRVQDKTAGDGGSKGKKPMPPPFSPDLFVRRIHLLIGETLLPVWSDPRLPSLPQEAASRVLAAVLELMQSLQAESSHSSLMKQRQRALRSSQERAALAAAGAGAGGDAAGRASSRISAGRVAPHRWSFLNRAREAAAPPIPFAPDERSITQLMEMGFTREHVLMALRATESNRVEVAMEYLLTHPAPAPAPAPAPSPSPATAGEAVAEETSAGSSADAAEGQETGTGSTATSTAATSAAVATSGTAIINEGAGGAAGSSDSVPVAAATAAAVGASSATAGTAAGENGDVDINVGSPELARMRQLVAEAHQMANEALAESRAEERLWQLGLGGASARDGAAAAAVGAGAGSEAASTGGAASAGGRGEPGEERATEEEALTRVLQTALSRMETTGNERPVEVTAGAGPRTASGSEAGAAESLTEWVAAAASPRAGEDDSGARTLRTNEEADAVMEDVLREDHDIVQRMEAILTEVQRQEGAAEDNDAGATGAADARALSVSQTAAVLAAGRAARMATLAARDAARRLAAADRGTAGDGTAEQRANTTQRLQNALLRRMTEDGGSLRLYPSSSTSGRDEEKDKAAAEKSHQEQEEADLKKVCSALKALIVRFQATIEESCFRLVTEADVQATAAAAAAAGGGGGGAQEGHGNASRRRDRERLGASSGMSFMVANFLAEQARANHRSSSSSSNNNNGRVPEITQQPANSIATPNTNSSSSSSSPRRSSASATRPTSMSPVRRTGDISSSRGTGASVAASLDGPSLVLSCIRRAEALLPSAGTLATPVGGGGVSLAAPGLAGVLHVLLLLATGVTETQRAALVTAGFHLKLAELFRTTIASLRRAQRDNRASAGGNEAGSTESTSPSTVAVVEWPDYMTPCLLLLDLVAKPSNVAKGTELQQQEQQQQQQQQAPAGSRGPGSLYETFRASLELEPLADPQLPPPPPQPREAELPWGPAVNRGGDGGLRREGRRSAEAQGDEGNDGHSSAHGAGVAAGAASVAASTAVDSGGAKPTETMSSSSTSPTEGGPPARAESKESGTGRTGGTGRVKMTSSQADEEGQDGGGAPDSAESKETQGTVPTEATASETGTRSSSSSAPSRAESKTSSDWLLEELSKRTTSPDDSKDDSSADKAGTAPVNTTPAAPPPVPVAPELHVLLSPQLMSDILESFIEFFAGVAVPPHFSTAAAAVIGEGEGGEGQAAAAAAEGAAAAGPALPAPSPNLVLASLQLLVRLVRDYGRANRFITAGGASSLLALPGSSAFEGSTALLAVVFRHLLEDPVTLQSAMETEIRAAFTRISRLAGNSQSAGADAAANSAAAGGRDNPPTVRLIALMSVLRPLLVRDGRVLVQAAANVLRSVDKPGGAEATAGAAGAAGASGGDTGTGNVFVTLATTHKHATAAAAAAAASGDKDKLTSAGQPVANGVDSQPTTTVAPVTPSAVAGTPARQRAAAGGVSGTSAVAGAVGGSGPASARSERLEKEGRTACIASSGGGSGSVSSGAAHQNRTTVMSLLLSELVLRHEGVVRRAGTNSADGTGATVAAAAMGSIGESEFLSEANLLVILSDLVLHLPACATAIHRFGQRERSFHAARLLAPTPGDEVAPRPGSAWAVARAMRVLLSLRHAVTGAEAPNTTVVAFLLHVLLPSPRAGDGAAKGITDAEEKRKRKAASALQGRKAQAAARLLLSLCARAGEGRRRVLAELYWALSCHEREGGGGSGSPSTPRDDRGRRTDTEMWALQAWGELALGLAAPRAAHAAGHDYGNQALAWDVVRAVTDLGAVSALTRALARVDLNHSRAPACGAALVRPLEMLTRVSVAENMRRMRAKDDGRGAAVAGTLAAAAAATEAATAAAQAATSLSSAAGSAAAAATGIGTGGVSTPSRRGRGRRRESRTPGSVAGAGSGSNGAAVASSGAAAGGASGGGGSGGSGAGPRTPGRRSSSRRRAGAAGVAAGGGSGSGGMVDASGGSSEGPGAGGGAGAVSAGDSPSRTRMGSASTPGRITSGAGAAGGGAAAIMPSTAARPGALRTRTASQDSRAGLQSFADDDVMLDEAFGGQTAARRDDMLVEVDLSSIVAGMEDEGAASRAGHGDGGRRHRHRASRMAGGASYDGGQSFNHMDEGLLDMSVDPGPGALDSSSDSEAHPDGVRDIGLTSSSSSDGAGGRNGHDDDDDDDDHDGQQGRVVQRGDVMDDGEEDEEDDGSDDEDDDDDEEEDDEDGEEEEGEEEEDGDEDEEDDDGDDDGEELDEEEIDLEAEMAADHGMADEEGVYVLTGRGGGDEDMPPELDWGVEEAFTRQDLGAIYAQVGWDRNPQVGWDRNSGGGSAAAAGAAGLAATVAAWSGSPGGAGGIHPFAHQFDSTEAAGNDGWLRGSAEEQLRLFGVQSPPGLARQYATTRHGERAGGGMNVMTMSDFIESDSALSQLLRSTPPGVMGVNGSPVVRIVRGAGADGRWTETQMITHELHAVPTGPSVNTTRLFPDGPSAATQAHAVPVVHPLLMGQTRGTAVATGTTRSNGRGSRVSRGSTGGGSASARHQAALGLQPNERLIWEGQAGSPIPEGTLINAIEGLNVVVNQPFGTAGTGAQMAGGGGRSATGGSSGASARRVAAAGIAGASGPPMANEGRWTDNGQPLTAAEGRTVLPMLEQVEQAVGARLLPFRQAVAAMAVEAGCRADPGQPENGEFKEEQEEKESKEEGRTTAETAAAAAPAAASTPGTTPPQRTAVSAAMSVIDSLLQPDGAESTGPRDSNVAESSAAAADGTEPSAAAATEGTEGTTPMAMEDTASVSEGEAVAALASSLSLSPRRVFDSGDTRSAAAAAAATALLGTDTPTAVAAVSRAESGETAAGGITAATYTEPRDVGNALAAILQSVDRAAASAEAAMAADRARAAGRAAVAAADAAVAAMGGTGDAMDVEEDSGRVEESKDAEVGERQADSSSGGGDDHSAATAAVSGSSDVVEGAGSRAANIGAAGDRMEEEEEEAAEEKDEQGGDTAATEGSAGDTGEEGAVAGGGEGEGGAGGDGAGTSCPPGMDPDVFAQLPPEMQQEVIREHRSTVGAMADQADLLEAAGLDPEALAALPPEMRREVLEQEARNRRMREAPPAAPADPSRAAEMDNASFVATLPPELRQEVLLSADENLLGTLPPSLVAEAMMLRERNPHQAEYHAAQAAQAVGFSAGMRANQASGGGARARATTAGVQAGGAGAGASRHQAEAKDPHHGEWKVEADLRGSHNTPPQVPRETVMMLIRLLHLLNPVRPQRLLQRTVLNLCAGHPVVRRAVIQALVHLVNSDPHRLKLALQALPSSDGSPTSRRRAQQQQRQRRLKEGGKDGGGGGSSDSEFDSEDGKPTGGGGGGGGSGGGSSPNNDTAGDPVPPPLNLGRVQEERGAQDDFPPRRLLGPASDSTAQPTFVASAFRSNDTTRRGGNDRGRAAGGVGDDMVVHPMVARRGLEFLWYLCKTNSRVTYDMLTVGPAGSDGTGDDDIAGGTSDSRTSSVAESKGSGKGKGKGRRVTTPKGKGKQSEAMDLPDIVGSTCAEGAASGSAHGVLLEQLMDLLDRPLYTMSGPDLNELLQLIDVLVQPLANIKEHKPGDSTAAAEAKDSGNAQPTAAAAATAVANDVESSAEESKMEVDGDGAAAAATAAGAAAAALLDGGAANAGPDGAGRGTGAGAGDDASATAASDKYEWVKIPEPVVQHERLRLLCSVLRLESCSDSSFQRVGSVVSNLSKVRENRLTLLKELVSVARSLGSVSTKDLESLGQQLEVVKTEAVARAAQSKADDAASVAAAAETVKKGKGKAPAERRLRAGAGGRSVGGGARSARAGLPPLVVNLNSSTSELKLLRVLQTLVTLSGKDADMLENLVRKLELDGLWDALSSCLTVVSVLEGVADEDDVIDDSALSGGLGGDGAGADGAAGGSGGGAASGGARRQSGDGDGSDAAADGGGAQSAKRTSAMAGLVARFLPIVEAFFVANARDPKGADKPLEEEEFSDDPILAEGGEAEVEQQGEAAVPPPSTATGSQPPVAADSASSATEAAVAGRSSPTSAVTAREEGGATAGTVAAASTVAAAGAATVAASSATAPSPASLNGEDLPDSVAAAVAGSDRTDMEVSGIETERQAAGAAAGAVAAMPMNSGGESKPEEGNDAGGGSGNGTAEAGAAEAGAAVEGSGAAGPRVGTRFSRRESLQRMTSMPGARFRKNVPRNMRPLAEAEAEKGATPESQRLSRFVARHKSLLNALLHQNPTLLDKSLSAMVHNPRCRQHLDFENKRAFFRSQLRRLRQHSTRRYGSVRLTVPRNQVFESSFHQLQLRNAEEVRGRLHITFQNEDGIDAGGLTREWYSILAREIFNQNYALFIAAADGATFQPNPVSHVNSDHLAYFKFVGRIVGKAIADGQALDAHFTQSFYKHILGVQVTHQDMEAIDPNYYKNLLQITTLPLEDLGLDLTFSADTEMFGRHEVVDLIPNGRNMMVTDENKLEYVQRITYHRMTHSIRAQIESFLEGFHELVPPEFISIFTPKELELLISGLPDIDLDDLQNNTEYTTFKSTDKEIQWFWNVLRSFSREDLALFLQYVTGTSKVPLGGFAMLQGMRGIQKFNIHKAFGGSHLLPAAHTCFNQLDLPKYTSEEMTRERTLLAIHQGSEGFGFG